MLWFFKRNTTQDSVFSLWWWRPQGTIGKQKKTWPVPKLNQHWLFLKIQQSYQSNRSTARSSWTKLSCCPSCILVWFISTFVSGFSSSFLWFVLFWQWLPIERKPVNQMIDWLFHNSSCSSQMNIHTHHQHTTLWLIMLDLLEIRPYPKLMAMGEDRDITLFNEEVGHKLSSLFTTTTLYRVHITAPTHLSISGSQKKHLHLQLTRSQKFNLLFGCTK